MQHLTDWNAVKIPNFSIILMPSVLYKKFITNFYYPCKAQSETYKLYLAYPQSNLKYTCFFLFVLSFLRNNTEKLMLNVLQMRSVVFTTV